MENEKPTLRPLILIFVIITFFIFVISFTTFYTTENFSSVCGCKLPIWVIIVSISSLGLFVGSLTYYLLSKNYMSEKKRIEKDFLKILNILDENDKKVIEALIEKKGEASQSYLGKALGLNKVKISRIISKMENKGIIKKEKKGMTNKVILNEELKEILLI